MGRSRKKAAARKREASMTVTGLPMLAGVPRRTSGGRLARQERPTEDARLVALAARGHQLGLTPDRDTRRAMTAPWLGCDLGRVMHRLCDGEREKVRLWSVWQGWCSAERTYRLRYLGRTDEPQNSALPVLPEKMETDTGHTIDTRSADEKDRDAVTAWMRWQGHLGSLLVTEHAVRLQQARRGDGPPLWRDGGQTDVGVATLRALRALADVMERR